MPRYAIETAYDADDSLEYDRLAGRPIGIATADWPRYRGQPMQLLATVDLEGRSIGVPVADKARAVMVFVDSYYETGLGDPSALAIRFVTQVMIDEHGETEPPDDFYAESYPEDEPMFLSLEETDEELEIEDSVLGGELIWPEETGEPETIPEGRFVLRLCDFRGMSSGAVMGFEGGAVLVGLYEQDEAEQQPTWTEALAMTREIVLTDDPPESPLFKFGGAPPAFFEYGWPTDSRDRPLTHLMTLPASVLTLGREIDDEDEVAVSYFFDRRRAALETWSAEPLIESESVCSGDLNEDGAELPEGVELLPEKRITLRELDGDLHWRELLGRNVIGPRSVFHNPAGDFTEASNRAQMQLEATFLPDVTREGTLFISQYADTLYQQPGEVGRGSHDDEFDDYDDYEDYEDSDEDNGSVSVSPGMRLLTLEGGTRSYVGGLPPNIGLERWPRYEGELMTHVMTLNVADIPDLAGHSCAAISVFLSTANGHRAFGPHSDHAAVLTVSSDEFERRCTPPDSEVLEVLREQALGISTPGEGDSPSGSFAGGRPRWIQQAQSAGSFLAQINEDLVDINLGDSGTLYIFDDTAFFQCY